MRRLIAPAALLLAAAAAACTTTTGNTNTGAGNANNANAGASANVGAASAPAGPAQADIEARERATLDAIKAKNWDAFGAMLTEDFVVVGAEGVEARAAMLESMKKYDLSEYTLSDFRLVRVDADLAVLTYTVTEKSTYDGKPTPGKPARGSTAWVNRGGKWLAAYHQETEVAEAPPGPPPTPAASPAASPSPAAAPAASPRPAPASAADAEKAVWEAIRSKNYDAFADFLLPEAIEVEPEKTYTKAESLEAVKQFDASEFTQSDFKETKLDADATLVTYMLKGPVEGKTVTEYHSTIWTNRGGRWKAAFHQGSRQQ